MLRQSHYVRILLYAMLLCAFNHMYIIMYAYVYITYVCMQNGV